MEPATLRLWLGVLVAGSIVLWMLWRYGRLRPPPVVQEPAAVVGVPLSIGRTSYTELTSRMQSSSQATAVTPLCQWDAHQGVAVDTDGRLRRWSPSVGDAEAWTLRAGGSTHATLNDRPGIHLGVNDMLETTKPVPVSLVGHVVFVEATMHNVRKGRRILFAQRGGDEGSLGGVMLRLEGTVLHTYCRTSDGVWYDSSGQVPTYIEFLRPSRPPCSPTKPMCGGSSLTGTPGTRRWWWFDWKPPSSVPSLISYSHPHGRVGVRCNHRNHLIAPGRPLQ